MRRGARIAGAGVALCLSAVCARAAAELPPPQRGVPVPGRPLATNDDASSLAQNPANLGFLPSPELRWTVVSTSDTAKIPNRGHSFDLGVPLFGPLSAGLRLDLVRPPRPELGGRSRWLTWGFALAPSRAVSLGFSFASSRSSDARADGLFGVTTSLSARPSRYLALAGVLRDWNGASSAGDGRLVRSYDVGLAARPLGTRAFELAIEGQKLASRDAWTPRFVLGVDVPYVGRLRGDVSIVDPFRAESRGWIATAGLDLNGLGAQAQGGAIFGDLAGDKAGFYAGVALRGVREPGATASAEVVKLRIESVPGNREHARLLARLWRLAKSDEVSAVALHLKAAPAGSSAHAEELGDAIRMLRAHGKRVFCHLEDAGGRALQVCAQADRTVINPAGGVRFAGLRLQYTYYGELLAKLGVRTDFVRIGAHKAAAESFARGGPTPTADDDHRELLREFEGAWLHDVGGGRRISVPELTARVARGPFVAREAKDAGLVDGYAYDDELELVATEVLGRPARLVDAKSAAAFAPRAPREIGERDRVAMVWVDGDMIDGRSRNVPVVGSKLVGSYTIAGALRAAREDTRVRAVVLRIESGGGSSMAADVMWREVELTKRVKPVVVSMGSTAASGGYYIAAPGSVVFANRTTLTGSIGIFYGKADVAALAAKLGVNVVTYKSSPRADAESIYRPFSDDERAELGKKVKQFYDTFIDRVARGRGLSPAEVDAVARGRVWTGQQAHARRLVDRVGGLRQALAEARKLGGLSDDAPVVELPEVPRTLVDVALELAGVRAKTDEEQLLIPTQLRAVLRAFVPLAAFGDGVPLARMELEPVEP
ncbi:MAG: signal peptide peptidase SppA [Polyangiaceae bacterium]|nr:signal peptide peptidase SppA [Polyangiaceae bacterium]